MTPDFVEIVDYKTDRGRHGEAEYHKQMSVYYHVAKEFYPHHEISTSILYTETGTRRHISPLTVDEIQTLVSEVD